MNYLELKEMREKYNDNAIIACWAILVFYIIGVVIMGGTVGLFNLILAANLMFITTIVVIGLIVPMIICALKIYLYLGDEVKEARSKENWQSISRMKECCLN